MPQGRTDWAQGAARAGRAGTGVAWACVRDPPSPAVNDWQHARQGMIGNVPWVALGSFAPMFFQYLGMLYSNTCVVSMCSLPTVLLPPLHVWPAAQLTCGHPMPHAYPRTTQRLIGNLVSCTATCLTTWPITCPTTCLALHILYASARTAPHACHLPMHVTSPRLSPSSWLSAAAGPLYPCVLACSPQP